MVQEQVNNEQGGRLFRAAWIQGVLHYFPGTPKSGYTVQWEDMPEWERQAAMAVYDKTRAFILAGLRQEPPVQLASEQGGRFIGEAWNVQVYRHIATPKPSYVADWEDLPEWQRKTDIAIFEAIQSAVFQEHKQD
jgi:hypothetical protein